MSPTALSQKSAHLRNTANAKKARIRSIASSTAIETQEPVKKIEAKLRERRFRHHHQVTLA